MGGSHVQTVIASQGRIFLTLPATHRRGLRRLKAAPLLNYVTMHSSPPVLRICAGANCDEGETRRTRRGQLGKLRRRPKSRLRTNREHYGDASWQRSEPQKRAARSGGKPKADSTARATDRV